MHGMSTNCNYYRMLFCVIKYLQNPATTNGRPLNFLIRGPGSSPGSGSGSSFGSGGGLQGVTEAL